VADLPLIQPAEEATKKSRVKSSCEAAEYQSQSGKRQKLSDVDRKARCRERNRINMRNMRERIKNRLDNLRQVVKDLELERQELLITVLDDSLAEVLNNLLGREVLDEEKNLDFNDLDDAYFDFDI
jgi:hypothetical protein